MPDTNNKERINLVTNNIMNITNIVNNLPNYLNTADANALNIDILSGKTAYVNGTKITGTMNNQGDVTIDPTTSSQLYNGGYYNSISINAVTSSIDPNITSNNIANGINILGIIGTFEGGANTMDATATSNDIIFGLTAYGNNQKLVGSLNTINGTSYYNLNSFNVANDTINNTIKFKGQVNSDIALRNEAYIVIQETYSNIATGMNITNDKIPVGINLVGIEGSYTSDANATDYNIIANYTAYVNGVKITGTYVPAIEPNEYNNCLNLTNDILS